MSAPDHRILVLNARDSVGVALVDLKPGDSIGHDGITASDAISSGHKVALQDLAEGEVILKYGQVIGTASTPIAAGAHVHTHNVRCETTELQEAAVVPKPKAEPRDATFRGFRRASGKVGTRNYIGIIASVNCSATVAKAVAAAFDDAQFDGADGVDGVVAFTHSTGCGMAPSGEGTEILRRTLSGYAEHPNLGGVLVIGLGCEMMQTDRFTDEDMDRPDRPIRTLAIQEAGGTRQAIEEGKHIVAAIIEQLSDARREEVSAKHLTLGLQCGGSDAWSGITANPALGAAADRVVAAGGTVILSETPEIHGAEQLLFARAKDHAVRAALEARLAWWSDYMARNGAELNNNPSPGNIAGGLTTILEKSLGAVAKSGCSTLQHVYHYAEPVDARGFVFMDSPGYDPCSATGQIASGANILAFTTGRGSVFGSKPAPCIKLASNAKMARWMEEDMDIDCSPVLESGDIEDMGESVFQSLLEVASGHRSKSEELGLGDLEFVPWQIGAVV